MIALSSKHYFLLPPAHFFIFQFFFQKEGTFATILSHNLTSAEIIGFIIMLNYTYYANYYEVVSENYIWISQQEGGWQEIESEQLNQAKEEHRQSTYY